MPISQRDRKKYALKTKRDERILEKIRAWKKRAKNKEERALAAFCLSQLEWDWRTPLEKFVDGKNRKDFFQKCNWRSELR